MEREYTTWEAAGHVLVWLIITATIGFVTWQALWHLAGADGVL